MTLAKLANAEERLTLQGIREASGSPISVSSQNKEDDRQEKVGSQRLSDIAGYL